MIGQKKYERKFGEEWLRNVTCGKCKKKGHYANRCPSNRNNRINELLEKIEMLEISEEIKKNYYTN
mgnify:FL=1